MKITIDPDMDTLENLELTVKILESKIADRTIFDHDENKRILMIIDELEETHGNKIPIRVLEEKIDITEQQLENLKRRGDIYEPERGFIARIK
jgi:predicted ArsR family transcriptional regulator